MSFLVIVLVALFFVSGADAASMVMGMLSSRGSSRPRAGRHVLGRAHRRLRGGAAARRRAEALQQAAIIAAAPFLLVMIGLCVSLWKALHDDERPAVVPDEARHRLRPEPEEPASPRCRPPACSRPEPFSFDRP